MYLTYACQYLAATYSIIAAHYYRNSLSCSRCGDCAECRAIADRYAADAAVARRWGYGYYN